MTPKLYHFELTSNEIYEVVAMDFADACDTLSEECPEIEQDQILHIVEHESPQPGETIH